MDSREKEYCKITGSAIRTLRTAKNKSIRLFAYENDIPQATMSRIERGNNDIQLTSLKKIAEGLGLKMSDLFDYIENKTPDGFSILEDY